MPGHVVLAPDKFKGSLTATEVARHLRAGVHRVRPDVAVRELPMADGGEGTVAAALAAGFAEHRVEVADPLGRPIQASFATSTAEPRTAVVEMALASGLAFTDADDDAARRSSTRGTGELVLAALDVGAQRVIVGAGGSATTDGGAGALAALGARLLDSRRRPLPDGGAALADLAHLDLTGLDPRLREVEVVLASDVDNPLLGPDGAAATFGPQKGAAADTVLELDAALTAWVQRLREAGVPAAVSDAVVPGAGAAGGLGYGLMAVLGATRRPGVELVLELTGFTDAVRGAALVVTGEGSLDEQSLGGKTPVGVARAAAAAGVPVVAVAGRCALRPEQAASVGIVSTYALADLEPDPRTSMTQAGRLLEDVAERIAAEHLTEAE